MGIEDKLIQSYGCIQVDCAAGVKAVETTNLDIGKIFVGTLSVPEAVRRMANSIQGGQYFTITIEKMSLHVGQFCRTL